jgi:hypothetical protein
MGKRLFILVAIMMLFSSGGIYASDLNGVDTETQVSIEPNQDKQTTVEQSSNAKAVGDMFSEAGPKAEDIKEAQVFIQPFAKIMNFAMAVILGITALLMMAVSVLDLLYMVFPPVRDILDGGSYGGQPQTRNPRGMGMQGQMGIENGSSMNVRGMQGNEPGGGFSSLGRWVSDEAIAACMESKGGVAIGGMPTAPKSMIIGYLKKRAIFLSMFGVCVILFTSTVFTDLGIKLGMRILNFIIGISI